MSVTSSDSNTRQFLMQHSFLAMDRIRRNLSTTLTKLFPRPCAAGVFSCVNFIFCCGRLGRLEDAAHAGEVLKVLVIGLDCSGKTALLTRLSKSGGTLQAPAALAREISSNPAYVPTEGYQMSTISRDGHQIEFWEMGGKEEHRSLWETQTIDKQCVIFVMGSERQQEALLELQAFRRSAPAEMPVVAVFIVNEGSDTLEVDLGFDVEVVTCSLSSPQSMSLVWRTVVDAAKV
eukprot:gene357-711_t